MDRKLTRLLLACALFLFGAGSVGRAHIAPILFAPPTAASYTGPCDVVTCAEAHSVTRAMKNSYSGNLLQIARLSDSSTLNIGQAADRSADLSGVFNFCFLDTCVVKKIYGQINGNDLIAVDNTVTSHPGGCTSTLACAALFLIDPQNGLPIIRTAVPATYALAADGTATGITGGTAAITVFKYGRNEGWTDCCGTYGLSHTFAAPDTVGTFFGQWNRYGQVNNTFFQCSSTTTVCSGISEESADRDGADYSPATNQNFMGMITWDGAAATNTVKVYVNSATAIFSGSPPCAEKNSGNCVYGVHPLNLPTSIHFGSGGDTSHVDTIWREGLFINGAASSSDYTALSGNLTTFYNARSANACSATASIAYQWNPNGSPGTTYTPQLSTALAYGLYQMRPDYYGPIAELYRSSDTTTSVFGPASTGCGLGNNSGGTSAATWCASTTCYVKTLYNQGLLSLAADPVNHDSALDMVQATQASRPSVTFSGLNSRPVITFGGSQLLCSGGAGSIWGRFSTLAIVGRRTGSTTSYSIGISQYNATNTLIGWNNAANQGETYSPLMTGAANDNTYHSFVAQQNNITGTATFYINGSSASTGSGVYYTLQFGGLCMGANADGSQKLTGDMAEAAVLSNFQPGSAANDGYGYVDQHSAIFAAQQAIWGSLPH